MKTKRMKYHRLFLTGVQDENSIPIGIGYDRYLCGRFL